ncbi:thioesterase family protein [Fretibacter rubidus]|uniref:thioesterase family protein n=1 Tax=Fretibacter rubidus TaxID=570162 RepID=UPI00352BB086
MTATMNATMLDSYFGEAVQWECDDLGHLNMRHYMTKVHQARQFFFIRLGLPHAFEASADSSVRTREFTVRYLKESRPGARLKIRTAITTLDDVSANLVHIMTHYDGTISAVITETVEHIYLRTGDAFTWPARVRDAAPQFATPLPASAMTRGIPDAPITSKSAKVLRGGGAETIGAGVFQPSEVDQFQSVTPQSLLGRITESVGNFEALWPEIHESFNSGGTISGALLEIKGRIHRWPTVGHACEIYSAVQDANPYTRLAAHHIVDPVSGQSWASFFASGCVFDLESRKLVKTPEARIKALKSIALPELAA